MKTLFLTDSEATQLFEIVDSYLKVRVKYSRDVEINSLWQKIHELTGSKKPQKRFNKKACCKIKHNTHGDSYIVDSNYERTGRYVYGVGELTPEEMKDEICHLMDIIMALQDPINQCKKIIKKGGFC